MKWKVSIFALICLSTSICLDAQGQNPGLEWLTQATGPDSKSIQAVAVDNEGNTLIAIYANSEFTFAGVQIPFMSLLDPSWYPYGATLIKLDPSGDVLWQRSLRGPWQEMAFCGGIDTDEDNNIYVGYTGISSIDNGSPIGGLYASSPSNHDYFLVKISPEGQGLWYEVANYVPSNTLTFPAPAPKVKVSPDGGVYSCGFIRTSVNFDGTILVNQHIASMYATKHDSNGNLLWVKKIESENGSVSSLMSLEVGSDGSLYICSTWKGAALHVDNLSIENDLAFTNNQDRWICKIAPDGTAQWLLREHSAGNENVANLAVTSEDDLLVFSTKGDADLFVANNTVAGTGMVLSRYNSSGEVISATLLGDPVGLLLDAPRITNNGDGSYFVAGSFAGPTFSFGGVEVSNAGGNTGTTDAFIAKIDAEGNAEWIYTFGSEEAERASFIASMDADRFIVGGFFTGNELTIQGTTLLPYTPFIGEPYLASFGVVLNTRSAEALQQLLAYPNPFSENVQFDTDALQAFGNATLVVFNANGTEVFRKQLQGIDAGQISLAHLPKGAYVARISDGIRSLHTKIIKQ